MYIESEFTAEQYWSEDDFKGSAHFFLMSDDHDRLLELDDRHNYFSKSTRSIITSDRILVDLVINRVSFQDADFDQLEPHVGETFSHHFYGYSPVMLNVNARLVDTTHSIGKAEFMELYRWLFRARRVARTGIVPVLSFTGCTAQGTMLSLDISESSQLQDVLQVKFAFLVFAMKYQNPLNSRGSINVNYTGAFNIWQLNSDQAEKEPDPVEDPDVELASFDPYTDPTTA